MRCLLILLMLLDVGVYALIAFLVSRGGKKQATPRTSLVVGVLGLLTAPVCLIVLGVIGLSMVGGPLGLALGVLGLRKAHAAKKAGLMVPKRYIALNIVVIVVSLLNLYFWSPLTSLREFLPPTPRFQ